jgi:hypothetical protein
VRVLKPLLALVSLCAFVFVAVTWLALESSGVGVLRTQKSDGSARETHVWYAADGGALWIEAATPEREFLDDLRRDPAVVLVRDGEPAPYRARIDPAGHARIRTLLRAKYGMRDWWVGLLQDTSRSVAVELRPDADTASRGSA